jgi:TetR/AcrR family transcriptional regulator, tetracycline repressor protein
MDRIRAAAFDLIDEEGLDALSMRRLAGVLDVDPMSVYHHVGDKQALLQSLIDHVVEMHAPTDDTSAPWRARVRGWARQYRALAMAHPALVRVLVADTAASSRFVTDTLEPLFQALTESGLTAPEIVDVADTLVDYVHGFVLAESARPGGFSRAEHLTSLDPDRTPAAARVLGALGQRELQYDFDAGFDRGLEVILGGIDRYGR